MSVSRKEVHPDLIKERNNGNFDSKEIAVFMRGGQENYDKYNDFITTMENDPILCSSHKFYEMTREEMMISQSQKLRRLWDLDKEKYFLNFSEINLTHHDFYQGLLPNGLNQSMFLISVRNLASDE